ncbi:hypothetical protein FN846DRAFT_949169 [Sphaerosporella brunnea]|uniref:Uncharacterized protein n=1 Tax=Sphaerosporella brunnea TaxID=1250544 RepID=A0A5J5EWW5_9PEZI|nr:hypothetical protein FN846DRAFT_949169 [Sphaerosporella brunnea]
MAKTRSGEGFSRNMDDLKEVNQKASAYIKNIPATQWAVSRSPAPRYGHLTLNIVESVNGKSLKERELLILDLLDALWAKKMDSHFMRLELA